jgi:hypothetical protein
VRVTWKEKGNKKQMTLMVMVGWLGEGYYKNTTVEEEIYVEGGDFGHCESVSLCYPASKPPTGAPTVSENPSNPPA